MGGIGSGRRDQGGKRTTNDYRTLDVRRLQRDGLLSTGKSFCWSWTRSGEKLASINVSTESDRVILDYRRQSDGGEWKSENYPVRVEWTACNYGGMRAWFRCPTTGCGRRVAVLYGGTIFACRYCYRLAYSSQLENMDDRATRRAGKIRDRLKWEPGILNGHCRKLKGMHWRTYQQLAVEHDALVDISLGRMQQRVQKIEDELGGMSDDLNLFRKIGL